MGNPNIYLINRSILFHVNAFLIGGPFTFYTSLFEIKKKVLQLFRQGYKKSSNIDTFDHCREFMFFLLLNISLNALLLIEHY